MTWILFFSEYNVTDNILGGQCDWHKLRNLDSHVIKLTNEIKI